MPVATPISSHTSATAVARRDVAIYPGAFLSQAERDRATDAAPRARHEGGFPRQPPPVSSPSHVAGPFRWIPHGTVPASEPRKGFRITIDTTRR